MYAVIRDGSRTHKVTEGMTILVDRRNLPMGAQIVFDDVALYVKGDDVRIGQPRVEGVKVVGEVLGVKRGKKLIVFKMKRREKCRRKRGHRQRFTSVQIKQIEARPT